MYKGHSDWSYIARVKNNPRIKIPIFGNGDINSARKAKEYKETYDVDGIMIGRASIGNPWIFSQIKHFLKTGEELPPPTLEQRIEAAKNHAIWSVEWKGERTGLLEMRQHYSNYFRGIPNFKSYKTKLLSAISLCELEQVFTNILENENE